MEFLGENIYHKTFGKGVIIEMHLDIIKVQFEKKISQFKYPDSFEKFLRFEKSELQKQATEDILKQKAKLENEKRKREEELKQLVLSQKQIDRPIREVGVPAEVSLSVIPKKLVRNLHKGYGGKAQVIYDECCKRFGWDYSKRYLFGMLQILYAQEATPERFSPWFLPHNNLTDTKGGNWFNKIQGDIIEEMWLERDDRFYSDKTHRVTFVKNKSKEYIFLGIYKPIKEETIILKSNIMKDGKIIKKAGEKVGIKTYQLVFDSYPQ